MLVLGLVEIIKTPLSHFVSVAQSQPLVHLVGVEALVEERVRRFLDIDSSRLQVHVGLVVGVLGQLDRRFAQFLDSVHDSPLFFVDGGSSQQLSPVGGPRLDSIA